MIYYSVQTERDLARGRRVAAACQFAMGVLGGLMFAIAWRMVDCGY